MNSMIQYHLWSRILCNYVTNTEHTLLKLTNSIPRFLFSFEILFCRNYRCWFLVDYYFFDVP